MRFVTHDDHRLNNALTVEELIDELKSLPPKAKVLFSCTYGDHGDTMQALPVTTVDELESNEALAESPYSHSGVALEKCNYDGSDDQLERFEAASEQTEVVVLR